VDHVSHTSPVDGVVIVDHDYLRGRRVFARVAVTYRYGREEDEVMGLHFSKELELVNTEVAPHAGDVQMTDVQERLIKKLGANAYPITVNLPENAPCSVSLDGGSEGSVRIFIHFYLFVKDLFLILSNLSKDDLIIRFNDFYRKKY